MIESVGRVLAIAAVLLFLPALIGWGLAEEVRSTRTNLPLDERRRLSRKAFVITFLILLAAELLVVGACLAEM